MIQLSERQNAVIAAGLTAVCAALVLAAISGLLYGLGLFLGRFSHVFLPLAVAAVFALVVRPYFDWYVERLRLPRTLAVVAVFASLLLPILGLGWFFGALVVEQLTDLVRNLPQLGAKLLDQIETRLPQVAQYWEREGLTGRLRELVEGKEAAMWSALQYLGTQAWSAGAGALGVVGKLLSWVVMPVYIGFFLVLDPGEGRRHPENLLPFLKTETRDDVVYLVREFVNILVAFFRGQLIIALLQGLLFAIGFTLAGLKYGLVIGLSLGFLNIVPYLGNLIGLGIALPLAYFQPDGGGGTLLWVIVVFIVVQNIEAYFLTPKIMGDRTGLHPMAIIVAIFFWGSALNGLTGMILAIPLTAFFVVFWRLAREKYIAELV